MADLGRCRPCNRPKSKSISEGLGSFQGPFWAGVSESRYNYNGALPSSKAGVHNQGAAIICLQGGEHVTLGAGANGVRGRFQRSHVGCMWGAGALCC